MLQRTGSANSTPWMENLWALLTPPSTFKAPPSTSSNMEPPYNHISAAASQMLSFLWHTIHKCLKNLKERADKTMVVSPKVEYCASIWEPYHQKYISSIEKVQRKAVCFETNTPHRYNSPVSGTSLTQDLSWESPQGRKQHLRLTSFYKLMEDMVDIPAQYHPAADLLD